MLRLEVDWRSAIEVIYSNSVFVIVNVDSLYESYRNEDEYLHRLVLISKKVHIHVRDRYESHEITVVI